MGLRMSSHDIDTGNTDHRSRNHHAPSRAGSALRPVRYLAWGIIIGITLGFGASELWHRNNPAPTPAAAEVIQSSIKSDFALVDHTGNPVTDENYRGKWLLVFFGFTNCPDVCPTALDEIAVVMDNLGEKAAKVQPLFVTVDPERDTPARMAEFVGAFDPRITGLTGTLEQIKASTKSFKVYFAKEAQAGAPDGYTMGHTTSLYLIDPRGRFVRPYSYNATIKEISNDLLAKL